MRFSTERANGGGGTQSDALACHSKTYCDIMNMKPLPELIAIVFVICDNTSVSREGSQAHESRYEGGGL